MTYYEIPRGLTVFGEEHQYLAIDGVTVENGALRLTLLQNCLRAWQEDDTSVRFYKHRYGNPTSTPVDMKEFMWIKLSAKHIG